MRSLLPGVVGPRGRVTRPRWSLTAGAVISLLVVSATDGTTDLKRGDPAPPLVMEAIDGHRVDTGAMRGRVVLLLFGEAGQDKTHQACREIVTALEAKQLADQPIDWILILSKSSSIIDLDLDAIEIEPPPVIVRDETRSAFGAYKTLVVPTVVVVGRDGRVVHALASYTNRFGDIVFDALSVAVGSLSVEEFEQMLHPPTDASAELHARRRAGRLVHFADRLCQRGLDDMAEAKYVEALELAPGLRSAQLGLGNLLLRRGRFDEAEHEFVKVLAEEPESPSARLGRAFVSAYRGGPELDQAESTARELIEHDGSWARAHFLMGLIHEQRGDHAAAADSFRTAAELLLSRIGPEGPAEKGRRSP
ncbi:MAG: tetratricopeptide repeat protein [Planctomycetota bacterium]|jgi:tetratricopeptide (TPR) repeat protein